MIGSFISDDFYFFFEERDIKRLKRAGKAEGVFASPRNTLPTGILRMKLTVSVFKMNPKRMSTDIAISFDKKLVNFFISEDDLNEWLVNPDDWVRDHGPSWRCGSSNVYIKRGTSKDFLSHKRNIMNFITKAK